MLSFQTNIRLFLGPEYTIMICLSLDLKKHLTVLYCCSASVPRGIREIELPECYEFIVMVPADSR